MIKVTLLGKGKMGRAIEEIAPENEISITSTKADVYIDFSHPSCVLDHIEKVATLGKPIVIGTTGWYAELDKAKEIIASRNTGLVWAPNFSTGVLLFLEIVKQAASLLKPYDPYIIEEHHKYKTDSPSGTAIAMQELIKKEVPTSSIRCGEIPGTHTMKFESTNDTIEIKHTARNRTMWAKGAIMAAKWIVDKQGFYSFKEIVHEL